MSSKEIFAISDSVTLMLLVLVHRVSGFSTVTVYIPPLSTLIVSFDSLSVALSVPSKLDRDQL